MTSWQSNSSPDASSDEENLPQTTLLARDKGPMAKERAPRPETAPLTPPWRLLIQIGSHKPTTVGLEVTDQIIIGRADPTEPFTPDLDLTPYSGQEGGVSRRHARIRQEGGALFLEDLGSTNGTRLNGGQLEVSHQYRLYDGDEVEVGQVKLMIQIIREPL